MATRTIGTEIVLSGEKQFNDAMKSINSGLKTTKSDMALVTAEFADNADSVEALTAKQKLLQSSVDQHRAKVDALREMYKHQKAEYGENSAAADKYKQQLNQATVALLKEESTLKKTSSALEEKIKSEKEAEASSGKFAKAQEVIKKANPVNLIKQTSAGYKNLVERLAEAQERTEEFAEKQEKARAKLAQVAKPLTALPSLAGKAAVGFTKIGVAGVAGLAAVSGAALTAMVNMAKEAADAAKQAAEAGEELTETQQQWLDYSKNLDSLDASVANAKSALAGMLLPALGDLSTTGAAFLNDFTADMTAAAGDTGKQSEVITQYIKKGVELIKNELPKYLEIGKALISSLMEGIGEVGPDVLDMGLDLVMDLLDLIFEFAPQLVDMGMVLIQKLIEGLVDKGPDLLESAVNMVVQIVMGLAQAAPELIPMAAKLIMMLVTGLIENMPELLAAGWELIEGILLGIKEGLGVILDMGSEIVQQLKDGIADAWDSFVNWFNSLWDNAFKGRKVDVEVNGDNGNVDGSHASGLNYVPFDGYLARLHRGEAVLTASEAAAYRSGEAKNNAKVVNVTINPQSMSREEMDYVVSYVNRKLGEVV